MFTLDFMNDYMLTAEELAEVLQVDPLSANLTETLAHLRITVGRWKVRTDGDRERLDEIRSKFAPPPRR